ncbi:translation initiation factor aIF2 subunit gamma [Candidatus Mancarchaeum acidiphilum]|uniref:protein-synthesizing GTPase n=1 Tax=Candidatus Mancarchaeum acidiphilum TaxID=1920749 RepID=A0A218NML4_9ARCH|nr:translation initiation factor aIF2 subunit gamma [Candidatus Mancarchaeum acidiphilum]
MLDQIKHSVINIGTLGHIDHGKTSLVQALTHQWTDRDSESLKRNMTIRLGYADTIINECEDSKGNKVYTVNDKYEGCKNAPVPFMRISILDAPGHETLMATAIASANLINALLFVIAANEPCPMPQTKEHLMIINLLGIKDVIIVQTKIDIVGEKAAEENYKQIKEFIKGSIIEDAPIIPVVSTKNINIDVLLKKIVEMPKPKFDENQDPFMYIARSFDVNKPGKKINKLVGGVIGGTLIRGKLNPGDTIEIRPGIKVSSPNQKREVYKPVITKIVEIDNGSDKLDYALPGGLIGISTLMDPQFSKADGLVGNVAGFPDKLPPVINSMNIAYHSLNRPDMHDNAFSVNEPVILSIGTLTVVGYVEKVRKNSIEISIKHPVCAESGQKIAIMRNINKRWKLTGYATLEKPKD